MNILVTGGAGFIGSHLVEAFLAEVNSVSIIDDLSTGKESNLHPGAMFLRMVLCPPDYAYFYFDLRRYPVLSV
jgi:UDP-glucose 4-epimerase